jgi:hypothetical protein
VKILPVLCVAYVNPVHLGANEVNDKQPVFLIEAVVNLESHGVGISSDDVQRTALDNSIQLGRHALVIVGDSHPTKELRVFLPVHLGGNRPVVTDCGLQIGDPTASEAAVVRRCATGKNRGENCECRAHMSLTLFRPPKRSLVPGVLKKSSFP